MIKQNKINEWLMIIIFIEYNINIKTLHLILDFCLSFNNFYYISNSYYFRLANHKICLDEDKNLGMTNTKVILVEIQLTLSLFLVKKCNSPLLN